MNVAKNQFYFIKDDYFQIFNKMSEGKLMQNKTVTSRPCYLPFLDKTTNIYWVIPISSKVEKYKKIYNNKLQKYKKCDTICFGYVLGEERAFLIQNMFPVLEKHIEKEYVSKNGDVVTINNPYKLKEIESKARKILSLQRAGKSFLIVDVLKIEKILLNEQKVCINC